MVVYSIAPASSKAPFTAAMVGCFALRSRDIAIDIRFGPLLLAATERGLVRIAFEREDFDAVLETVGLELIEDAPNEICAQELAGVGLGAFPGFPGGGADSPGIDRCGASRPLRGGGRACRLAAFFADASCDASRGGS